MSTVSLMQSSALLPKGVKIRIVQTPPNEQFPSLDTIELQKKGLAEVRLLDMTRLTGGGILHTKMWLVDGKHFYVGSANQDWRALTQVFSLFRGMFHPLSHNSDHLSIKFLFVVSILIQPLRS